MILEAKQPEKPAGILIDTGTGKRIPFARKANFETGEYEALTPAPNGVDVLVDPCTRAPVIRKGRATGKLELVPFGKAAAVGCAAPKKVAGTVEPMTAEERLEGLEQYKKVFIDVWRWRGESGRCALSRWSAFLESNDFLDSLVIRRKPCG